MSHFVRWILQRRAVIAGLLLVSLGAALYSARTIRVRFQFRDYFDYSNNPRMPVFRDDVEQFGDPAGFVVAMIEADDVLRRDVLEYVQTLTRALEPDARFVRVRSLTNVKIVEGKDDEVVSSAAVDKLPDTPADTAALRTRLLSNPLLVRRLISTDATMTAVLGVMRAPAAFASIDQQAEAHEALASAVDKLPRPPGVRVRVTGAPSVEVGTTRALVEDQFLLMPAVTSILLLALYLMFRSVYGIVLCMTAVSVATLWTAGLFALSGRPVDIVGSVIPTTILVYGVVDPIFVFTRFRHKLDDGLRKHDAIVAALSELALPCFITSVTTAIGFAAFVTARIPSLRAYGLTVAVGVLLSWVTTVTVLPVLLTFVPVPKQPFSALATTQRVDTWMRRFWAFVQPRLRATIGGALILLIAGAVYARDQHIDNQYVGGLPLGEAQDNVRVLEDKLSGVLRVIVHLSGPEGSMKNPEVLQAITRLEDQAKKDPLVTTASSLSDALAEANRAFHNGDLSEHHVPRSPALIAQFMTLIDPADRADLVTTDYAKSHVVFLLKDYGSETTRIFVKDLQALVDAEDFNKYGVTAELTGNGVVAYQEVDHSVVELVYGFVLAFVVILVTQWVVFRSARVAFLSALPNLLPVVACFATMTLFGIKMRGDSALVLCVSIGGLFNTTIQYAVRVRQRVKESHDAPDAVVLHALRAVGPAAWFTALTLSAGFSVLLLSTFPGLRALGLLSTVTFLVGVLADTLITPALFRVWFPWDKHAAQAQPHVATGLETDATA